MSVLLFFAEWPREVLVQLVTNHEKAFALNILWALYWLAILLVRYPTKENLAQCFDPDTSHQKKREWRIDFRRTFVRFGKLSHLGDKERIQSAMQSSKLIFLTKNTNRTICEFTRLIIWTKNYSIRNRHSV